MPEEGNQCFAEVHIADEERVMGDNNSGPGEAGDGAAEASVAGEKAE
jgi:hypothetical protein